MPAHRFFECLGGDAYLANVSKCRVVCDWDYWFLALGGLIRFVEAIYHEECEHEMFLGGLRLPLLLSSPANAL